MRRGIPRDGGPIGSMLEEHEIGRKQVAEMRQCLAIDDADGVRRASLEYVTLLRAHIQKEDFVLFPMGKRALDEGDVEALRQRFAEVDRSGDLGRKAPQGHGTGTGR